MTSPDKAVLCRPLTIFVPHASDMLTDHLSHGDGLVAYAMLRQLALRGHTVHVATPRLEVEGPPTPGLHVHVLPQRGDGMLGRIGFAFAMRRLFRRLCRTVTFDLVHQLNPVFAGISLAQPRSGLPLVLGTFVATWPNDPETISGGAGIWSGATRTLRDAVAAWQQRAAAMLLLTAPAAMNRLPRPNAVRDRIRWLSHGVDTDVFRPATDAGSPERAAEEQAHPSVLFLANVAQRKGIEPLVDAWREVVQQLPQARLTVAGDGPDLPAMRAHVDAHGLSASVQFVGQVERSAVPGLMQTHAVYVLPSLGEPLSTSLLEAISCGRPCVVTDSGGPPDMLPAGGGLVAATGKAAPLAEALLRLLRDPELRRTAGIVNRDRALRCLTWPHIAETLEGYYAELVPAARQRVPAAYRARPDARQRVSATHRAQPANRARLVPPVQLAPSNQP